MTRDQLKKIEADLWAAADALRANSDLKSSEYSTPVLGLIFLKFADNNYRRHEVEILEEYKKLKGIRLLAAIKKRLNFQTQRDKQIQDSIDGNSLGNRCSIRLSARR